MTENRLFGCFLTSVAALYGSSSAFTNEPNSASERIKLLHTVSGLTHPFKHKST